MTTPHKTPTWFTATIVVLLIWNLLGVLNFVMQYTMTDTDILLLPENQQIFHTKISLLSKVAFGMGVFGGTFGCILLLAKKSIASKFFWISFVGIILQANYNLELANGGEMQSVIISMSSLLIVLTLLLLYLTKKGLKNNWLN